MFFACEKSEIKEEETPINYQYSALISRPMASESFSYGDTIPLQIRFESGTNEIVHNIKIEIFNKTIPQLSLYLVQSHVHEVGVFDFEDFALVKDSLPANTDSNWYCKASLWSHEVDAEIISDSLEFVINQ